MAQRINSNTCNNTYCSRRLPLRRYVYCPRKLPRLAQPWRQQLRGCRRCYCGSSSRGNNRSLGPAWRFNQYGRHQRPRAAWRHYWPHCRHCSGVLVGRACLGRLMLGTYSGRSWTLRRIPM